MCQENLQGFVSELVSAVLADGKVVHLSFQPRPMGPCVDSKPNLENRQREKSERREERIHLILAKSTSCIYLFCSL